MSHYQTLALLLGFLAAPGGAATLTVEGTASPAWVERSGAPREPLAVGMALANGDRVVTGSGSRALLRLADGSAVKLGENAVLALDGLGGRSGDRARTIVTASLDVLRGAFRFTTELFGRQRAGRDVKVRLATVTTGVRGTDLFGKSEEQRDLVCLIEGSIEVRRGTDAPVPLDQPLDFYVAPRDGSTPTKSKASRQQLQQWTAETELGAVPGGARRGGGFQVEVSAANEQQSALRDYDILREAGFPAVIRPEAAETGTVYRVRIGNVPTEEDARALAGKVRALGFPTAAAGR